MSVLLTDKLQPRTTGIAITVVGDMDVTGNISVAGTVTYEDVTNVDSLGIITARTGLRVTDGGVVINAGVTTITDDLKVNSTLTATEGLNVTAGVTTIAGTSSFANTLNITGGEVKVGAAFSVSQAGVVTATSYYGDGSNLSNITSTTINNNADNRIITGSGTANTLEGESNLTFDGNNLAMSGTGVFTITRNSRTLTLEGNYGNEGHPAIKTSSGHNLRIFTSGNNERLRITSGGDVEIDGTAAGVSSVTWDASANSLIFKDNSKAAFGTGSDLQVYYDGTNGYIKGGSSGELVIRHDAITMQAASSTDTYFDAAYDGSVSLFYNNSKKFETSNDGTVTTGISTATAFVPTEGQLSNRNIIINGDMAIWQRGTTAINSSVNKYLVDRFKVLSVSDGDGSISQHTNVPTQVQTGGVQFAYSLRLNCTTADTSLAANQYIIVSQRVEGRNLRHLGFGLAGTRYATLQFWQRSPAGTYYVSFRNGSYNRYYLGAYTIASANTWEKHSITIPIDTQGTWASDHSTGLDIQWSLGTGSATGSVGSWTGGSSHAGTGQKNFFDTVGNDFYLTGVQFEAGSVATPFESIDYGSELAKCQRYYYPITAPEGFINATEDIGIGRPNSSTEVQLRVSPPAQMRATPSVEATTGSQYFRISNGNLGGDKYLSNAWIINNMSPTGGFLYTQPDDNLGSYIGESATVQSKSTSARLALKSEL